MRLHSFCSMISLISLTIGGDMYGLQTTLAQVTPASMTSGTQGSKSIEPLEPLKPLESSKKNEKTEKFKKPEALPIPVAAPKFVSERADYLHPGILVNARGEWEGSDHLLNISSNIGVYITIIKPENEQLAFNEASLKDQVVNIFKLANIKPEILVSPGKPPLPVFQIEIFAYPIDKGYVACCYGRLFESVTLDRFKMDSNMAFQAITWEKQHLIVSPKDEFSDEIVKVVQDIAQTFGERFQVYEKIKKNL